MFAILYLNYLLCLELAAYCVHVTGNVSHVYPHIQPDAYIVDFFVQISQYHLDAR